MVAQDVPKKEPRHVSQSTRDTAVVEREVDEFVDHGDVPLVTVPAAELTLDSPSLP